MLENMEKNKIKSRISGDNLERIHKREQEMLMKK